MRVLVTGAAGNLGSATCAALLAGGVEVRATDRMTRPNLPVTVRVANLMDREGCYTLIEGVDAIIHLGNHPNPGSADPQRLMTENTAMNVNVFQAAKELGVKKIAFASSVQVINGDRRVPEKGPTPPSMLAYLPADGDTPANPANLYSLSKRAGEIMLESYARFHAMSCTAVRFPMLVTHAWGEWFAKQPIEGGAGGLVDEAFSYLFFEDAAELLAAIVKSDLPGYRVYFPASPNPIRNRPIRELIETYYPGVRLLRPIEQITSLVDTSRIQRDTGWGPTRALQGEPTTQITQTTEDPERPLT